MNEDSQSQENQDLQQAYAQNLQPEEGQMQTHHESITGFNFDENGRV
jgi:hypothetical protein